MIRLLIRTIVWLVRTLFRSREDLAIENLALRQQLAVLKQEHPRQRLMVLSRVDPVEWGTTVMFRI